MASSRLSSNSTCAEAQWVDGATATTFAAIVANFIAGKRLSKRSRSIVALLYALAVVVLVSRWYYVATEVIQFRQQLQELGVTLLVPWITATARVVLVAIGTSASLIFLLTNWLHDDPNDRVK